MFDSCNSKVYLTEKANALLQKPKVYALAAEHYTPLVAAAVVSVRGSSGSGDGSGGGSGSGSGSGIDGIDESDDGDAAAEPMCNPMTAPAAAISKLYYMQSQMQDAVEMAPPHTSQEMWKHMQILVTRAVKTLLQIKALRNLLAVAAAPLSGGASVGGVGDGGGGGGEDGGGGDVQQRLDKAAPLVQWVCATIVEYFQQELCNHADDRYSYDWRLIWNAFQYKCTE